MLPCEFTMKAIEAKVVVLGTQGVGKTSIISRYTGKVFNKHVSPTIGATFFCCALNILDVRVKLKIWDTAGQERFRSMAPMYYRNANAAFLVYDITSYESYMDMKSWVEELQQNIEEYVFICILGNKTDIVQNRQVKLEEAQEYANSIGAAFVETSAISNDGVESAFVEMARGLILISQNTPSAMNVFDSAASTPSTPTAAEPFFPRESVILQSPSDSADEKPTLCC